MNFDDIRKAAEEKYTSFVVELNDKKLEMLSPIRLPKERRDELSKLFADMASDETDSDELEMIERVIKLVAKDNVTGRALVQAVNKDLAVAATLLAKYQEAVSLGEA